ncbi:MAG: transglycosylase domain-containing protein [Alphaproteobacteria bacterium]|nr:transglycosylase domain-containing protein [Alphaproteobacteria bacterium]
MRSVARRVAGVALMASGAGLLVLLGLAWPRATLRSPDPSVLLQDRDGAYLGEVNVPPDGRLGFWPAGTGRCAEMPEDAPDPGACLPDKVVAATLAIEDRKFDRHPGVDPGAVARALRQNVANADRISGASTIPMQVARLQDPGSRTYARKAVEALTALLLVDRYGREAVLAQYLRLAPYGNNVHGVRYAARRYFGKPLADLTWAEASLLAALPQAPGQMNPYDLHGRRRAIGRALRILDQLLEDGTIDGDTHESARQELGRLRFGARPSRPEAALLPVLALDAMLDGADAPELRTTLDLELQEHVERVLLHQVLDWEARGAGQAAAVVVDRETMEVRAAVGSIGYHGTKAGSMDFTQVRRYPGSTLKPFLYAHALDRGTIRPDSVLDDLTHGPQGIRNADDDFLGPMLPRQALANSRNVPAVELAEEVGLVELYEVWRTLGLHDGRVDAEHYGLGLAIGGMPVRLVDLVAAYGALANDGDLRPLTWYGAPAPARRVFSADHARLVSLWLSDPVARTPTFPRAGHSEYPFAVAVKTGTSPDFRDSWAVAWSEQYIVGIWVGHPDWRPMQGLSGYSGAGKLVHDVMLHLHADEADGLSNVAFAGPAGWTTATVCAHTGLLATDHCDAPRIEHFPPGGAPVHACEAHRMVDGRVVTDLPSRYAAWMRQAGITPAPQLAGNPSAPVSVAVLSPRDGTRVVRDPEVPADRSTLRLAAAVDPPGEQVVWLVDGEPFAVVDYPYTARWPVQPGDHTFEARLAYRPEKSAPVKVEAR